MCKKNVKLILSLILIGLLTINTSWAEIIGNVKEMGLSEDYLKWIQLPEEEKKDTKMPRTYDITIKEAMKRSQYNTLKGASTDSKFNLSDKIKINVKNQENTNSCWAFAATSALETFLAMKNNNVFDTYSTRHMEYTMAKNSFTDGTNTKGLNRTVGTGGNTQLSGAYYASGKGPVLEKDMPFVNSESSILLADINKTVNKNIKGYKTFPNIYKSVENGTIKYSSTRTYSSQNSYSDSEVSAIRNEIKQFLQTKGAVTVSMQAESQYLNDDKIDAGKTDKYAFYCDSNTAYGNHAVTLVGWDDTFSKENFNDSHKPVHDGAWIILNSWGTDADSATNDGYIYVSYDDAVVETDMMGIVEVTDVDYDNLYQHDEFGASNALVAQLGSIYTANVYDTKEKGKEELKRVGVTVITTQNIEIYANVSGNDFTKLEKVASPGVLEPGYYAIQLTTPKKITGDKFIVAVKATNQEGVSVPIEYNPKSNGEPEVEGTATGFYSVVTAKEGESYISIDGVNYMDLLKNDIVGTIYKDINCCIKAYTTKEAETPTKVTSVSLDKSNVTLQEGAKQKLIATVAPSNAANKEVTWTSSDNAIATVDTTGNITGVKAGTATITVASKETPTIKATCTVTVIKAGDFTLSLDKTTAVLNKGEKVTLKPVFNPSTVNNQKVTWKSSDEKIATVDINGSVTAVEEGTATITVTSQENTQKTATCEVTVKGKISVESVTIDIKSKELYIGDKVKLNATIKPIEATDKTVTWKSSDEKIATVDINGNVTAKTKGTATITVTTNDGNKTDTSTITVKEKEIPQDVKVESISLNKTKVDIVVGDTTSLVVSFKPENATNKNVTWKIEDETIAKVDKNGIITALKTGKTNLTVITEDGNKTAVAEINVTKKANTDDDIYKPDTNKPNSNNDSTVSDTDLPFSGKMPVILALIVISGYMIIRFIRYHKLRDVK